MWVCFTRVIAAVLYRLILFSFIYNAIRASAVLISKSSALLLSTISVIESRLDNADSIPKPQSDNPCLISKVQDLLMV